MQTETLIKMANQIGDFFEAEPNITQAQLDIAQHLNRFWTKDMRNQIAAHVKGKSGAGLHSQVISAISAHLNP
ncbi:MAG: formate dehydrogenase subunit delta [Methylotenera sp.]